MDRQDIRFELHNSGYHRSAPQPEDQRYAKEIHSTHHGTGTCGARSNRLDSVRAVSIQGRSIVRQLPQFRLLDSGGIREEERRLVSTVR